MSEKKNILILAANPKTTDHLRLDKEIREIREGLRRSKYRDLFEIESRVAVRIKDFQRALLDHNPYIVHFTGHGNKDGIYVEDDMGMPFSVKREALPELFELFKDKVECVILSACFSKSQANLIRRHINYVIGMKRDILDDAAIEFAIGFYDALGAGRNVEDSFKLGIIAAKFEHPDQSSIPILIKKPKEEAGMNTTGDKPKTIAIRSMAGLQDDVIKKDKVDDILDLTDHFNGRFLQNGTWEDIKQEVSSFLKSTITAGKDYHFYIPLHCSLAFFVGRELPVKYGADISIYQPAPGSGRQLWQHSGVDADIKDADDWIIEEHEINPGGTKMGVALSVTHNIRANVETFIRKHIPGISRLVHVSLPKPKPGSIKSADHAFDASYEAVMAIREKYRELGVSRVHLFMAAPNVFSFYLGQHSILLRNITMYEYNLDSGIHDDYFPSIQI